MADLSPETRELMLKVLNKKEYQRIDTERMGDLNQGSNKKKQLHHMLTVAKQGIDSRQESIQEISTGIIKKHALSMSLGTHGIRPAELIDESVSDISLATTNKDQLKGSMVHKQLESAGNTSELLGLQSMLNQIDEKTTQQYQVPGKKQKQDFKVYR